MLAYHNDQKLKRKYLARVAKHRRLDQLVQGTGAQGEGANFRGCAVGCTLNKYDHHAYETELGVPMVLAHLEDRLFEGMAKEKAMLWPSRFLAAIPVGADLSLVWPAFAHWMLVDEKHGVIVHAKTDRTKDAIRGVAKLFERQLAGGSVSLAEWNEARRNTYADAAAAYAADAAAAYAAAAAADAAYAYAADAYADAAYAAYAYADAAYAAYAYADADADADAYADAYADARLRSRRAHYALMADKLEELLKAAPVKGEKRVR